MAFLIKESGSDRSSNETKNKIRKQQKRRVSQATYGDVHVRCMDVRCMDVWYLQDHLNIFNKELLRIKLAYRPRPCLSNCLSPLIASLSPCAAAFVHHSLAFEYDVSIPKPFAYIIPKLFCASRCP